MAFERPLLVSFDRYTARLTQGRGDYIPTYLAGVIPVHVVGRDEADQSRPLWHVTNQAFAAAGRFPGLSLTSGRDVAIERIRCWAQDASGVAIQTGVNVGTPSAAFDLFQFPANFTQPGVRPRRSFDVGNTVCIAHENTQVLTPVGGQFIIPVGIVGSTIPIAAGAPTPPANRECILDYSASPLYLEGGLFLTVQSFGAGTRLFGTFIYREL